MLHNKNGLGKCVITEPCSPMGGGCNLNLCRLSHLGIWKVKEGRFWVLSYNSPGPRHSSGASGLASMKSSTSPMVPLIFPGVLYVADKPDCIVKKASSWAMILSLQACFPAEISPELIIKYTDFVSFSGRAYCVLSLPFSLTYFQ